MSDVFLQLSAEDRIEALATAAAESGRPAHLLEKDVWVVWALRALFEAPLGEALVFKGGTSLSKAYDVIQRFSEDIDLTYDIRRLLPDLADALEDPVPATRAEERRWSRDVQRLLPLWVEGEVRPMLEARLAADGVVAGVRIEGAKAFVDYAPTSTGTGYVSPSVMLEFGARATGERPRGVALDLKHGASCCERDHATGVGEANGDPRVRVEDDAGTVFQPHGALLADGRGVGVRPLQGPPGQAPGSDHKRHGARDAERDQTAGVPQPTARARLFDPTQGLVGEPRHPGALRQRPCRVPHGFETAESARVLRVSPPRAERLHVGGRDLALVQLAEPVGGFLAPDVGFSLDHHPLPTGPAETRSTEAPWTFAIPPFSR